MAEPRQTLTVAIDAQELAGAHELQWTTMRKEITRDGALGVANNTGLLGLLINGHPVVRLWLHEDDLGYAVVDVFDGRNNRLARVDIELHGEAPPRRDRQVKRERRFGSDFPGAQR